MIHAYAGLTAFGVTPLIYVSGTAKPLNKSSKYKSKGVTAKEYIEVLDTKLLPFIRRIFQGKGMEFIF